MLNSQLEILAQARDYLKNVSQDQYNEIIKPNFISSAGAHIRHILDHYLAIITGSESNIINYDKRHRGGSVEHDPKAALDKLDEIMHWLTELSPEALEQTVLLSTEVSVSHQVIEQIPTSVARELIFVSSHAVHHYATIAQITLIQQASSNNTSYVPAFGIAPATATFLREQKAAS